jgi:hypothetical protein
MTVHDFIVIYNESFKYIEKNFGADAVKDFWKTISDQWCTHLRELVRSKGIAGMNEYWGGNDGTLGREKAECSIKIEDGIFKILMHKCPSVGELKERGREIYKGELSYCEHCPALYVPIAEESGFWMKFDIDYDEDGYCAGSCVLTAGKKD